MLEGAGIGYHFLKRKEFAEFKSCVLFVYASFLTDITSSVVLLRSFLKSLSNTTSSALKQLSFTDGQIETTINYSLNSLNIPTFWFYVHVLNSCRFFTFPEKSYSFNRFYCFSFQTGKESAHSFISLKQICQTFFRISIYLLTKSCIMLSIPSTPSSKAKRSDAMSIHPPNERLGHNRDGKLLI